MMSICARAAWSLEGRQRDPMKVKTNVACLFYLALSQEVCLGFLRLFTFYHKIHLLVKYHKPGHKRCRGIRDTH